MDSGEESEDTNLLARVALPVASKEDALATARRVLPYLAGASELVTVIHVVEDAQGISDGSSESTQEVRVSLDALERAADDFDIEVALYVVSERADIAEAILVAANDIKATSIVYTPRPRTWWDGLTRENVSGLLQARSALPLVIIPDSA
ncbi:MAG: hypothetical protein ACQEVA_10045 [Myxococcota bacterium]